MAKDKHTLPLPVYVLLGVLTTLMLVFIKFIFEKLPVSQKVEIATYEFLHWNLPPFNRDETLPIVVVDISKLSGGKDQVTPRDELKDLVLAIADQGPRAIAVDIDFSPDKDGWITDNDPDFFDTCLTIKRQKGIPVFLGVFRTIGEPSNMWLGLEEYKELAAATVSQDNDTRRMPRWIQTATMSEPLPTLSQALAQAYQKSLPEPPAWMAWSVQRIEGKQHGTERQPGKDLRFADTLVNYSKLEAIKEQSLFTIRRTSVEEASERFRNKMVILGDGYSATDNFIVPGRDKPVAGVYLHAIAAYTLVREPLYEFTHSVRFALDGLFPAIILLIIVLIRYRNCNKTKKVDWQKKERRLFGYSVCVVLILGVLMVRLLDVLWLDFFLVAIALVLHPKVEGCLSIYLSRISIKKKRLGMQRQRGENIHAQGEEHT